MTSEGLNIRGRDDSDGSQATHSAPSPGPVVETAAGKLRGAIEEGITSFKGIPYGAPTSGRNRFMPPRKPQPWAGIRDALALAGRAPQYKPNAGRPELTTVWGPIDELPTGEDCLTLHVWTPGLDEGRRPVMVWFHGGAFSYGSANVPRFDGTDLARRGDVVVVTVNHRLNILGHLYLAEIGGEAFADSGNVGVLDLIAALEWVRENIARFGGDPGSVTVFGQSGGGGKISTLMAMPAAKGLFHRAIVQSGAGIRMSKPSRATQVAEAVLRQLGLTAGQLDRLQEMPVAQLHAAIGPAEKTLPPVARPLLDRYLFGPVVDGRNLPVHPFDTGAPETADRVPLMIGDTKDEMSIFLAPDDAVWNRALSEEEMRARVRAVAGADADRVVETYRGLHPGADPAELLIAILTDSNFRVRSLLLADRKQARGGAPVWFYSFDWETPAYEGRLKAPHSLDTPFVFDTVGRIGAATTAGPEAAALSARVSATWAAFARTGNPENEAIPHWPAYTGESRAVMVFDSECRLGHIADSDPRFFWATKV